MRHSSRAAIFAVAAFLCCARLDSADARAAAPAAPATAAEGLARATVRFETAQGPWLVQVEVVSTPQDRARGLMFRRELQPDHGMLFIFDETEEHSFWMRNTFVALDMIFLTEDRRVAGVVANATPRTDVARTIGKASRYVVEVAGGEAGAHAIVPGTRAVFVGVRE
jgi:uncharacterized membrane protein (UPF0127 family)